MRLGNLLILFGLFLLFSCKKDPKINKAQNGSSLCSNYVYSYRTNPHFDFIESDLTTSGNVFGGTYFRKDKILYKTPCFNPNNDYEICYINDLDNGPTKKELWKYNFCNGKKTKISSNIYYSLDWSVKDWIIYTSSDQQIYKVKSNGDSLTLLTNGNGINAVGKWSPNGTKFWYKDGGTTYFICEEDGFVINSFTSTFIVLEWFNNENLIVNYGSKLCLYNVTNQTLSEPIHGETVSMMHCNIYDSKNKYFYFVNNLGRNNDDKYLLKLNINNNKVDTILKLWYSYKFVSGDLNSKSQTFILELARAEWKDSVMDFINFRQNVIVMKPDGTNQRLLNLD